MVTFLTYADESGTTLSKLNIAVSPCTSPIYFVKTTCKNKSSLELHVPALSLQTNAAFPYKSKRII